ncbi:MAG: hypothetical protein V8S42_09985 [Lachnospiraceae bacterium]
MSVEPGFGGQAFLDEAYGRIRRDWEVYLTATPLPVKIEVDGGIGKKNVREILRWQAPIYLLQDARYSRKEKHW